MTQWSSDDKEEEEEEEEEEKKQLRFNWELARAPLVSQEISSSVITEACLDADHNNHDDDAWTLIVMMMMISYIMSLKWWLNCDNFDNDYYIILHSWLVYCCTMSCSDIRVARQQPNQIDQSSILNISENSWGLPIHLLRVIRIFCFNGRFTPPSWDSLDLRHCMQHVILYFCVQLHTEHIMFVNIVNTCQIHWVYKVNNTWCSIKCRLIKFTVLQILATARWRCSHIQKEKQNVPILFSPPTKNISHLLFSLFIFILLVVQKKYFIKYSTLLLFLFYMDNVAWPPRIAWNILCGCGTPSER